MAGLTDPTINPTITTTQQSQTTAPDWYNSYLSGITAAGNNAITAGGVAGASPLQTAAYNLAPTAINAGQPATNQAIQTATNVATTPTSSMIDQYMNPYTDQVVNSIGEMGTRNFNQLLAPAATSSAVGSGQFGSKRGMRVYGDVARDVASNITAQQAQARTTGFNNALAAAQNQQNLGLSAANTLGNLGGQTLTQATSGLNTLSTLGAQQQAIDQARLNYPMEAQKNLAGIVSGLSIPTGATQSATGPAGGGQMGLSPLSQIASLGAGAAAFLGKPGSALGLTNKDGTPYTASLLSYLKGIDNAPPATTPGYNTALPNGATYAGVNANGEPVYNNPNIPNTFINGKGDDVGSPLAYDPNADNFDINNQDANNYIDPLGSDSNPIDYDQS